MAQCNGDGVGCIIGFGHSGQVEQPLGHVLNLVLGGVSVAHHGLLDLHGLILEYLHTGLPDGKQYHATALGHADAGGDILTEEQFFDGHHIGLSHLKQLGHVVINHFQPPGKFRVGGCGDGTAVQKAVIAPLGINETEAHDTVAGVDA